MSASSAVTASGASTGSGAVMESGAASAAGAVDLGVLARALLADAAGTTSGRAVEVLIDQPGQRVLAMAFLQGSGLPEHDAPPAASLQVWRGRVVLVTEAQRRMLGVGELVPIPQQRHHVEALQDSVCLLTVATTPVSS